MLANICDSTNWNGPVPSEVKTVLIFCYFLTDFLSAQFWSKNWDSDIAFLRYDNFIDDVWIDQLKVDFEKMALKVWESGQSINIKYQLKKVNFNMKTLFYVKSIRQLRE